jgi:hypothetical protein
MVSGSIINPYERQEEMIALFYLQSMVAIAAVLLLGVCVVGRDWRNALKLLGVIGFCAVALSAY